jgi:arylsulfatase A-like enzyme
MFTANPTTFGAFGFARGWDRFEQLSPVSGLASRTPISEATAWLEGRLQESKDGSVLVLVHARAGHPPWTATAEETKSLPPADYMGPIDARRGAQVLQRARAKRPKLRLSSADRERIEGFYRLALVSHDHALAGLIGMLRRLGAWDSTMLLVTSDVAMGGAGRVPFGDAEKLDEDLLSLPLLVRFPGGRFAGQAVDAATSTLDLARTVLGALELKPPEAVGGIDLFEVAANPERFALRPQLAVLGSEYSMRRGDWAIRAVAPKPPALCDFATQNACADAAPAAVAALLDPLFRQVYSSFRDANAREAAPTLREPATLDPDTSAALSVWGNQEAR